MVKAIIFDLGGVILNLDYDATAKEFERKFGIKNFASRMFSQGAQRAEMDAFERGEQLNSPSLFCEFLRGCQIFDSDERLKLSVVSDEEICGAWNAMLFDIPHERVSYLKSLRDRGFQVYLLSNINLVHEERVDRIIERDVKGGLDFWHSAFDRIFYSHHIGKRKPDPPTFEWVLKEIGVDASETLFFDDSVQHVKGASSVGIKSVLIPRMHGLVEIVEKALME
ncbi:HAD-superfamily hydrolase, subfamily IA, variant 3 [Obelidium mucronatum]|nr:HAD-superfamily hydrolase, subfamily IA, variant 3 [Obelidium mucronatum]